MRDCEEFVFFLIPLVLYACIDDEANLVQLRVATVKKHQFPTLS